MRHIRTYGSMLSLKPSMQLSSRFQRYRTPTYREFSVKVLSWCTKSPISKNKSSHILAEEEKLMPIDRFGIVAAMSRNRVIGVNGRLPWDIAEDRKLFKDLTKDKVLIIGRKTLQEESNLCHISHAAKCIVISKTLKDDQIDAMSSSSSSGTEIRLVRSFPEALHLARELVEATRSTTDDPNEIDCWVAGGERVFNAAVLHPSAKTIHLTVVAVDVDTSLVASSEVAKFPPNYYWDIRFKQASAVEMASVEGEPTSFIHYVYNRIKGAR